MTQTFKCGNQWLPLAAAQAYYRGESGRDVDEEKKPNDPVGERTNIIKEEIKKKELALKEKEEQEKNEADRLKAEQKKEDDKMAKLKELEEKDLAEKKAQEAAEKKAKEERLAVLESKTDKELKGECDKLGLRYGALAGRTAFIKLLLTQL
jgi:hypothetical protein